MPKRSRIAYPGASGGPTPPEPISLDEYHALQPRPPSAPRPARQTTHRAGTMAWAESEHWQFTTGPQGVLAWRAVAGGVERTARYDAGDGERLDQHYGAALGAVARGEYTRIADRPIDDRR